MKLKILKLNQLLEDNLNNREMNSLKGGGNLCFCSCYWADQGGSSIANNRSANYHSDSGDGYLSQHGCNNYMKCTDTGYKTWDFPGR